VTTPRHRASTLHSFSHPHRRLASAGPLNRRLAAIPFTPSESAARFLPVSPLTATIIWILFYWPFSNTSSSSQEHVYISLSISLSVSFCAHAFELVADRVLLPLFVQVAGQYTIQLSLLLTRPSTEFVFPQLERSFSCRPNIIPSSESEPLRSSPFVLCRTRNTFLTASTL